mmetsp:Transcript_33559/g.101411  ORF Transcript_33559/g.101411 Transcript_33559/m.101411 type:complete len:203 (+) Transcript_33559:182-790(+)
MGSNPKKGRRAQRVARERGGVVFLVFFWGGGLAQLVNRCQPCTQRRVDASKATGNGYRHWECRPPQSLESPAPLHPNRVVGGGGGAVVGEVPPLPPPPPPPPPWCLGTSTIMMITTMMPRISKSQTHHRTFCHHIVFLRVREVVLKRDDPDMSDSDLSCRSPRAVSRSSTFSMLFRITTTTSSTSFWACRSLSEPECIPEEL